jgi:hypothetical protein
MNKLIPIILAPVPPVLVTAAGDPAGIRFLDFFAANIRNPHTRRAYAKPLGRAFGAVRERRQVMGRARLDG